MLKFIQWLFLPISAKLYRTYYEENKNLVQERKMLLNRMIQLAEEVEFYKARMKTLDEELKRLEDLNLALKIGLCSHYGYCLYRTFAALATPEKITRTGNTEKIGKRQAKVLQEMTKEEIKIYRDWQVSHMYDVDVSELLYLQKYDIDTYVEMLKHYELWDLMNYG